MARYEFAKDIGIGYNVYSAKGRLVAWLLHEFIAASLVEKLNKEKSDGLSYR